MPDQKPGTAVKQIFQFRFLKSLPSFTLILIVAIVIFGALVLPISLRPTPSLLDVGDVAFQDIRAPRSFSFESAVLTERARDDAEKSVTPIYLPADPSISRKQIEKLRNILSFINSVRLDPYATESNQIRDLAAINDLQLTSEIVKNIVRIDDMSWESIQVESLFLLEEMMKSPIRDDQVSSARRNLSPRIGFEFDSTESEIIGTMVSQLIVANSLFSNEATAAAIEEMRASISPVSRQFQSGKSL